GEGDTQWMTSGRGVIHKEGPSEAFKARGGTLHGLQLWVNLPAAEKMRPASYQDIRATEVAVVEPSDGVTARVIAGDAFGVAGPGRTVTPINYVHLTLAPGSVARTSVPADHNVVAYPLVGSFSVPSSGGDAVLVPEAVMAVLGPGDEVELHGPADGEPAEVVLLTGQPLHEPVVREGPFVMNTRAELLQAFEDYSAGRFVEA
ncbi:MAG: pirin family protein, partial [Actinomycetes bacterium]